MKNTKVSVRFSEYEDLKNKIFCLKKLNDWCDNFNKINLKYKFFKYLKRKKVRICLVSPELFLEKKTKIKGLYLYLKKKKYSS